MISSWIARRAVSVNAPKPQQQVGPRMKRELDDWLDTLHALAQRHVARRAAVGEDAQATLSMGERDK